MENRANKLHKLDPVTYPRTGRMYFDLDPLKFERRMPESGPPIFSRSPCLMSWLPSVT